MSSAHRLASLSGRRALVSGHTGFKGAWLATWLHELGADVYGLALAPPAVGAYHELGVESFVHSRVGDVRDAAVVDAVVAETEPDLVFHLAAQPLVRRSWSDRRETYATNVMGTVNVVEAALRKRSLSGVVVATTDKVYENRETGQSFAETDRLGGHDPYSASKAAAEVALVPYRRATLMGLSGAPVVSVRAGNVIGGGDWSADRLVPDIVRALQSGEKIVLRRPDAVRPWQHVLDCLYGYLLVASSIATSMPVADAYNFAHDEAPTTVLEVTRSVVAAWGADDDVIVVEREDDAKEVSLLTLDASRAARDLGWRPTWSLEESIRQTVRFYRDPSVGRRQIEEFMEACGTGE